MLEMVQWNSALSEKLLALNLVSSINLKFLICN